LRHAQLDFTVGKSKLFTTGTDQEPNLDVPNFFSTVRTDTQQGVVGKEYQIVQNKNAFSFFDNIVGGDGIQYETAGAFGNGEKIFITVKLPSYIKVGYFQNVKNYKSDEVKLKSLFYGGVAQIRTQKAFDRCIDFATN
jgi:hypothetical protein